MGHMDLRGIDLTGASFSIRSFGSFDGTRWFYLFTPFVAVFQYPLFRII